LATAISSFDATNGNLKRLRSIAIFFPQFAFLIATFSTPMYAT
jgi:hypothetical protein